MCVVYVYGHCQICKQLRASVKVILEHTVGLLAPALSWLGSLGVCESLEPSASLGAKVHFSVAG